MTEIFKSSVRVGVVEAGGTVYGTSRNNLGKVSGGQVYNNKGSLIGKYDSSYVYRGLSRIGYLRGGKVFDYSDHKIGKVSGSDPEAGAAALLLLFAD